MFNVQHDCHAAGCNASGISKQIQERQESNKLVASIVHKENTRFVINTHGFHNASLLRKFLPRVLTVPRPLYPDQHGHHTEIAAEVALSLQTKRTARSAKAAATRKGKKKATGHMGNDEEGSGSEGQHGSDEDLEEEAQSRKRARVD